MLAARLGRLMAGNPALLLLLGSAVAQAIPILSSPLLARLYRPDAFGDLSVFIPALGVAGVVASGRYEMAIAGQRNAVDTDALLSLVMFLSVMAFLLLLPVSWWAAGSLGMPGLLWVAPTAVFYAVLQGAIYWFTYRGRFGLLSLIKVAQAVMVLVGAIMLARSVPETGLVGANVLGYFVAVAVALWMVRETGFRLASCHAIRAAAWRNLNWPLYGLLPAMLDSFSMLIPVWLVASEFGSREAGYFGLSRLVLAAPVALLAMTSSQVLLKQVGDHLRSDERMIDSFLRATLVALAAASVMAATVGLFGEGLFSWIFGEQWRRAGEYSSILVLAYASILVVSPLSAFLTVLHEVRLNGLWQGLHLAGVALLLLLDFNHDIQLLQAYVVIEVCLYFFYWVLIYRAVKRADDAGEHK